METVQFNHTVGVVTAVSRYIPDIIHAHFQTEYLPLVRNHWTGNSVSLKSRVFSLTVEFDQVIDNCFEEMFETSSLLITHLETEQSSPFSTSCILHVESDSSGYKSVKINKYALESKAGSTNSRNIELDFVYERTRPFLTLYDITTFDVTYPKKRKVIAVFSRSISDLTVRIILFHSIILENHS